MLVPGSNILNLALSIQGKQTVQYFKNNGTVKNGIGLLVTSYSDPVPLTGSFQPVPRTMYAQYGLDLSKNYATFYVSKHIVGVERDFSGDQFEYNSLRWQCEAPNDWFAQDGWVGALLVEVKKAAQ